MGGRGGDVAVCLLVDTCSTLSQPPMIPLTLHRAVFVPQVCVLVDQADNDASFRRQSKLDTGKTARELQVGQNGSAMMWLAE